MLRVTVELVPNGEEERLRELGQIEIANSDGNSLTTGSYHIVMDEFDERTPGQRTTFRTTAALDNVERDLIRPMQLVGLALGLVAPVKMTMHSFDEGLQGTILTREEI